MDAYRQFLKKTVAICLPVLLILTAIAGVISHPVVSLLGMAAFTIEGEDVTTVTLSVMLGGFCLAALLLDLWERKLDRSLRLLLVFGGVTALLVPLLRELLPFTLDGYVFPLVTGLAVPRLLLALLPSRQTPRLDRVLVAISGGVLLLLTAVGIYGALWEGDSLTGLILCRLLSLPLLWFAPLFDFYAKRRGMGSLSLSVTLGILPLFSLFGIPWAFVFRWFPLGVLLAAGAFVTTFLKKKRDSAP